MMPCGSTPPHRASCESTSTIAGVPPSGCGASRSPTRTTLVFCRWRSRSPARCSSAMGARSRCEDAPTAGHSSSCGCPVDEWMEDDVVQQEKATKRVLIVDDEPGVRESVRMLLKEAYEPVAVSSAP